MKKWLFAITLLVVSSSTANAQKGITESGGDVTCYNQIEYAYGWLGFDLYYGSACYSFLGTGSQVSFTPYFPVG